MTDWPRDCPDDESVEAFKCAFRSLGYADCDSPEHEPGLEKVAFYVNSKNEVTHAARQSPEWGGKWRSKCGKNWDIEHALNDLNGECYGSVRAIMSRKYEAPIGGLLDGQ